jgi:hypothetical protein
MRDEWGNLIAHRSIKAGITHGEASQKTQKKWFQSQFHVCSQEAGKEDILSNLPVRH